MKDLTLEDGTRFYDPDGKGWRPSVTTILDKGFPKAAEFMEWLKAKGDKADSIRDAAAERGTAIHKAIESLIAGDALSSVDFTKDEWECIRGAHNFILNDVASIVATETVVYDDLVAGRCDLICRLKNGDLAVIDFKTSSSLHLSHEAQVSKYAAMLESMTGDSHTPYLVHLSPRRKNRYLLQHIASKALALQAFDAALFFYTHLGGMTQPPPTRPIEELKLP